MTPPLNMEQQFNLVQAVEQVLWADEISSNITVTLWKCHLWLPSPMQAAVQIAIIITIDDSRL